MIRYMVWDNDQNRYVRTGRRDLWELEKTARCVCTSQARYEWRRRDWALRLEGKPRPPKPGPADGKTGRFVVHKVQINVVPEVQ